MGFGALTSRRRNLAVALLTLLVCGLAAAKNTKPPQHELPQAKTLVAVVVLAEDNADPKLVKALRAQLAPAAKALAKMRLLTGRPLANAIKANPEKALDKCGSDLSCIAGLGEKAKAQKVVLARVIRGAHGVDVKFLSINVATAAVEKRSLLPSPTPAKHERCSRPDSSSSCRIWAMAAAHQPHRPQKVGRLRHGGISSCPTAACLAAGSGACRSAGVGASGRVAFGGCACRQPGPPAETIVAAPAPAAPATTPQGREKEPTAVLEPRAPAARPEPEPATTSRLGTRGIERIEAAWPTAAKDLVISLGADGYTGKNRFGPYGTDSLIQEQLFVTGAPIKGLDLTISQSFSSNDNTAWTPATVQTLGSPTIGVKYGIELIPDFAVAAAVRALVPTSGQGHSFDFTATSVTGCCPPLTGRRPSSA